MKKKPFETFASDVTHKRIQFETRLFAAENRIDLNGGFYGMELHQIQDAIGKQLVIQLTAKVASRKFDVKTVRFPDGAGQAIKHALGQSFLMGVGLFRRWIKKHPVRFIEVTMEANAYNPTIAIPDHATFVEIVMREKYDFNP